MKIQSVNNTNQKVNFTSSVRVKNEELEEFKSMSHGIYFSNLREVLEDTFGLSLKSTLKIYEKIAGKNGDEQIFLGKDEKVVLKNEIKKAMKNPKRINSIESHPTLNKMVNTLIKSACEFSRM